MEYREYSKEQVESKTGDIDLIKRLLSYLRPYRTLLVIAIVVLIFAKAIEVSVPILIGNLSQKILDNLRIGEDALFDSVLHKSLLIIALLFFAYLLDSSNVVLRSWIGQKALYRLRMQIYDHILHMPLSYFDRHTMGRLMTRTIHDVDQINQMFAESVIPIISNLLLFFGIFIGIAILDWKIAILALAIFPFVWWSTSRFRYFQRICYDRVRTIVAAMNTFVQEHLMGASTIRSFGLQLQTKKKFDEINQDHYLAHVDTIRHFSLFMTGIDFIQNFSLIAAFVLIVAYSPAGSQFEVGTFFTFNLYALMFFRPLADLAERYNVLQSAMAAAVRIFNVLDQPSERVADKGHAILSDIETIAFEDVWFAYENQNWVLKGLSFEIRQGQSYALVGSTGEGKSTIMSLLLRFYEPQKGRIAINGRDIREYSLTSLRSHFSLVLQDPVIFSGTIADNVTLFDPAVERTEVESAINYLGMTPFVGRFSKGLDHILRERGQGLSAGEKQLVSLARAIIHRRSMLMLDEATANIDSLAEQLMQQAIEKVLKHQTALVIAHRLSTIKDVTNILVLHGGKIAEQGAHQDLLKRQGIYEKLYRLQFSI